MASAPSMKPAHRLAASLALAASLLACAAASTALAAPAAKMSAIDRLVAEDEIRQKIVLYGLLADGDNINKKDIQGLADQTLAPDVVSEVFYANGSLNMSSTGSDAIVKSTPPAQPNANTGSRHYLIQTYFDDLTPTAAKTRTTFLFLQMTRNMLGKDCAAAGMDACGQRVIRGITGVYHETWAKTPNGWRKTHIQIRFDN